MYVCERGIGGGGEGGEAVIGVSGPTGAKNTALYVVVFIKRDEWSHYINTMGADGRVKVGK